MLRGEFTRQLSAVGAVLVLATTAFGQGRTDYFNVESPQVNPIDVARVGGHDYLLVCNTPDNAVEIWDTDESLAPAARLLRRVQVGLEPVTVRWNPATGAFYTCDFLSDSVSVVALSDPGSGLEVVFEGTFAICDEPVDVAFGRTTLPQGAASGVAQAGGPPAGPGGGGGATGGTRSGGGGPDVGPGAGTETIPTLYVVSFSMHTLSWLDARTMTPITPEARARDLLDPTGPTVWGLKEPRALDYDGEQLLVLGFKGGDDPAVYDFDLYVADEAGGFVDRVGGLGSTNWNMERASNGDLYVVGFEAQIDLLSEPEVAAAPTGFVKTTLYRVERLDTPNPSSKRRDLNALVDDPGQGILTPVAFDEALTMATDVALYEVDGVVEKAFVAAMGSDRVGVLEPAPTGPATDWPLRRIDLAPVGGNDMAGPRGLVVKEANPADPADPGARLYVANRLDNSVTVIDPVSETIVDAFALAQDPTPDYVRAGRQYLYGAQFSGNGFNACATCHIDARTDGLAWDLGNRKAPNGPPLENLLVDGIPDGNPDSCPTNPKTLAFNDMVENGYQTKFEMVTQSLQGLLNWEVDPSVQDVVTNAPYHWRGDKPDLTFFNVAFVGLQGMAPFMGNPEMGISASAMKEFEEFVNSIHYPPNPKQLATRTFSGELGADPNDPETGSGAQWGKKLFHVNPIFERAGNGRSCVMCHWLPEGSTNRLTVMAANQGVFQPLETAALRGLFQKEARLDRDGFTFSETRIGEFGVTHIGSRPSINVQLLGFNPDFGGMNPDGTPKENMKALMQFVHEFDWGVAPVVGRVVTVTADNRGDAAVVREIDLLEDQVLRANASVAVRAVLGGVDLGYWMDGSASELGAATYRGEGNAFVGSRQELLDLPVADGDRLVFTATPLGSERRVASPTGVAAPLAGGTPSDVTLEPLRPNTAYRDVPLFTRNWDPADPMTGFEFEWVNPCAETPMSNKSLRQLQWGLINDGQGAYGLTALRHDAARRVRVAGDGIVPGASVLLFVPDDASAPDPFGPLEQIQTRLIELPIFPTGETTDDGRRVWETAVELDALTYCAFMLGGAKAPGVALVMTDIDNLVPEPPPAGTFDPDAYNWHYVIVQNPDGQAGDGGWQRLVLDPVP